MRAERLLLRIGEYLVGRACRQLPRDIGEERYREWAAELPVILQDRRIGPTPLRALCMLGYAADTLRGAALAGLRARPLPRWMTAAVFLLLAASLATVSVEVRAVVRGPGELVNYLRLAWGVLLVASSVGMLIRPGSRVSSLITGGSAVVGVAVSLWDAVQSPADWVNYFAAAVLFLFLLAMWIVRRWARTRQA